MILLVIKKKTNKRYMEQKKRNLSLYIQFEKKNYLASGNKSVKSYPH